MEKGIRRFSLIMSYINFLFRVGTHLPSLFRSSSSSHSGKSHSMLKRQMQASRAKDNN